MLHLPNSVWILNQQLSNLQEVNVTTEQSLPLSATKHGFNWKLHFIFSVDCTSHNTQTVFSPEKLDHLDCYYNRLDAVEVPMDELVAAMPDFLNSSYDKKAFEALDKVYPQMKCFFPEKK